MPGGRSFPAVPETTEQPRGILRIARDVLSAGEGVGWEGF